MLEGELVEDVDDFPPDFPAASSKKVATFASDDGGFDLAPFGFEFFQCGGGRAKNVRIEGPAQSTVAGDDGHDDAKLVPFLEQRMRVPIHAPAEGANCVSHLQCVRPCGKNAVLRALQLGRSDHLHRFRDLLSFFDGIDFPSDGLEAWHTLGEWKVEGYHLLQSEVKATHVGVANDRTDVVPSEVRGDAACSTMNCGGRRGS